MKPECILFAILLVLKIVGVLAWSWWWVTAPLWLPFLAGLIATGSMFALNLAFPPCYRHPNHS